MLDGVLRRLLDPALDRAGRALARRGVGPDALTLAGLAAGLGCAAAAALSADALALVLLALGRLADGLDGPTARAGSGARDAGGFLDIVCDFAAYGALPLAFAARDPAANALPACVLLFTFYVNGATFLALAALCAKRGLSLDARGPKSIVFSAGLAEGAETILAFALMLLLPRHFPLLALAFAGLTFMSALARTALARALLRDPPKDSSERGPGTLR